MQGINVYAMQLFRLHDMIYNPFLLNLHYYYFTMQCLYQAREGEVHVPSRVSEESGIFVQKMSFCILIKQLINVAIEIYICVLKKRLNSDGQHVH